MIKTKLGNVYEAWPVIQRMYVRSGQNGIAVRAKTSFRIARLVQQCGPYVNDVQTAQVALASKHGGQLNEQEGKFEFPANEDGARPGLDAFLAEWNDLMNQEVEISISPFLDFDLDPFNIAPAEAAAIEWMVNVEDN